MALWEGPCCILLGWQGVCGHSWGHTALWEHRVTVQGKVMHTCCPPGGQQELFPGLCWDCVLDSAHWQISKESQGMSQAEESIMAPVPTILSWPFLFNTMDIPCGAEGMECHVDTQPFWEHPQWPVWKAFVTGKQEPARMQGLFKPNERIHGSLCMSLFSVCSKCKEGLSKPQ